MIVERKNNLKKIHLCINLILYIFVLLYIPKIYQKNIEEFLLEIAFIALVFFLVNVTFYHKEYRYSFQLILLELALISFLFGDCYGYLFVKKNQLMFYFAKGNMKWIKDAYFYSLQFFVAINMGILMGEKFKFKILKKQFNYKKIKNYKKILCALLNLLILFNGIFIALIIKSFFSGGYKQVNLYLDTSFLILTFLRYFFNIFIVLLCVFNKKNKLYKLIYVIMSLLLFFLGSRSLAVGQILVFILYEYVISNRKINFKHYILMFFLSILIPLFACIRVGQKFDFTLLKKGPFLVINELGQTIPLILTIQYVPKYRDFECGRTFIDAIARITRMYNFFYTPIEYGSHWVTRIEGTSWGLGYSSVAEGYMNFGKYLGIYALILGIFYGYLLIIKDIRNVNEKITMLLSAPLLYFSFRSDFAYTMLFLFYYIFLFKVIFKLFILILEKIKYKYKK